MLTFLFLPLLTAVFAAPIDSSLHPDRLDNLPGAPIEPEFPLFSGYLTAEDNGTEHKLFYVLAEAIHGDPVEAPLIIWLNGGPGSSSLFGFLLIHGPYLLNAETGELRYNEFSWNQYANVLYLETPTGVGFSHSNDMGNLTYNDANTARINRKALQDFMTRVHPRYQKRDFYITGESYAGVYNPYFAREVLQHVKSGEFTNPNFKGIAMGNAHTDDYTETIASALQLYSLSMIPESYGKELFDLWERIIDGEKPTIPTRLRMELNMIRRYTLGPASNYDLPLQCNKAANNTIWHISKPVRNAECDPDNLIADYMNREDVQILMHVRASDEPTVLWKLSSDDVFDNYERESDTVPIYKDIIAAAEGDFRILFYTGDMDLVCPPLQVSYGARRIAEDNDMNKNNDTHHWTYLGDNGGARTSYFTNDSRVSVDVLTVRGASHMVPLTHPDRAFQLINNFINAEPKTQIDYSKMIPRRNS